MAPQHIFRILVEAGRREQAIALARAPVGSATEATTVGPAISGVGETGGCWP